MHAPGNVNVSEWTEKKFIIIFLEKSINNWLESNKEIELVSEWETRRVRKSNDTRVHTAGMHKQKR